MNPTNALENLRDIHLPGQVSAWPPAPGWWILAILIISLVVWIGLKLWKSYQEKHLLRVSITAVEKLEQEYKSHQDPQLLVRQYSSLVRRIAMALFPRQEVASLTGTAWLDFINDRAGQKLFSDELGQLILLGPYQKPTDDLEKISELTAAIQQWVLAVYQNKNKSPSTTIGDKNG